jgi:hypothetical protein
MISLQAKTTVHLIRGPCRVSINGHQEANKKNLIKVAMNGRRNPDAESAMQYLVWALEMIEKTGNKKAAKHARNALQALRETRDRSVDQNDEHAS